MSERFAFIRACLNRSERIVEICDRFGISEKTGHKWLQRFKTQGLDGLANQSRAPQHPHRMSAEIAARIIELRRKHPHYGAATLHDWLVQHYPDERWPAASTIGALLTREHLIRRKRRRHRAAERAALDGARTRALEPNMVWTADFKGQFRLTSGASCYPLTVLDLHTHYLLGCTALGTTAVAPTRQVFVRLFRQYGLPSILRTDNGVPFAQPNALGRLGALAFWWVRLGIRPEHITPATPSENGAHERFHRTLKAAATRPASPSLVAQQRRFDHFAAEYNLDRPHQSVPGHRPPSTVYTPSTRPYPPRLPAVCYPTATAVRLVDRNGFIKWKAHPLFLSSNLAREYVGLTHTDHELVTITYATLALGDFDPYTNRFNPRVRWMD
jgi:transposase InsO family protein